MIIEIIEYFLYQTWFLVLVLFLFDTQINYCIYKNSTKVKNQLMTKNIQKE